MADLFPDDPDGTIEGAPPHEKFEDSDEVENPEPAIDEEFRDLALAAESQIVHPEVTNPPSDEDQSQTEKIVTEAVESTDSSSEVEANRVKDGRIAPPSLS